MLKIETTSDGMSISVGGTLSTITIELCKAINGVYSMINNKDKGAAENFRQTLMLMILDSASPLFGDPQGEVTIVDCSAMRGGNHND